MCLIYIDKQKKILFFFLCKKVAPGTNILEYQQIACL